MADEELSVKVTVDIQDLKDDLADALKDLDFEGAGIDDDFKNTIETEFETIKAMQLLISDQLTRGLFTVRGFVVGGRTVGDVLAGVQKQLESGVEQPFQESFEKLVAILTQKYEEAGLMGTPIKELQGKKMGASTLSTFLKFFGGGKPISKLQMVDVLSGGLSEDDFRDAFIDSFKDVMSEKGYTKLFEGLSEDKVKGLKEFMNKAEKWGMKTDWVMINRKTKQVAVAEGKGVAITDVMIGEDQDRFARFLDEGKEFFEGFDAHFFLFGPRLKQGRAGGDPADPLSIQGGLADLMTQRVIQRSTEEILDKWGEVRVTPMITNAIDIIEAKFKQSGIVDIQEFISSAINNAVKQKFSQGVEEAKKVLHETR